MLTEAGARLQAAQDKIYLCNDDENSNRVPLEQLDDYFAKEANFWTMQVRIRRDNEVQRVEDRLNDEHKKNVKDAKERARLEAEFKWKNAKYSVTRMTVPVPPSEMQRSSSGMSARGKKGMLARQQSMSGVPLV